MHGWLKPTITYLSAHFVFEFLDSDFSFDSSIAHGGYSSYLLRKNPQNFKYEIEFDSGRIQRTQI